MKITALQVCLQRMLDRVGDVEVKILDDESGEMEPVEAVFHFTTGSVQDDWIELCTPGQCGDFPEGVTTRMSGDA